MPSSTLARIPKIVKPSLFAYHPLGVILDLDGKLAQYRGDKLHDHEPVREIWYAVSNIPTTDWPDLVGVKPWQPSGSPLWGGTVRIGWTDKYIDTEGWTRETRMVPIEAPRNGKTYFYTWRGGITGHGWYPQWYSTCHSCNDMHKPELVYCEACYRCHLPGGRCIP